MKFPTTIEAQLYKLLRTGVGMTSTEMAVNLGVSRETISRREAGTMKITQEAWLAASYISETANQVIQSYCDSMNIPDEHTSQEHIVLIETKQTRTVAAQPTQKAQPERTQPVPEAETSGVYKSSKHANWRGEKTTKPKRKKRR